VSRENPDVIGTIRKWFLDRRIDRRVKEAFWRNACTEFFCPWCRAWKSRSCIVGVFVPDNSAARKFAEVLFYAICKKHEKCGERMRTLIQDAAEDIFFQIIGLESEKWSAPVTVFVDDSYVSLGMNTLVGDPGSRYVLCSCGNSDFYIKAAPGQNGTKDPDIEKKCTKCRSISFSYKAMGENG